MLFPESRILIAEYVPPDPPPIITTSLIMELSMLYVWPLTVADVGAANTGYKSATIATEILAKEHILT
jgi:hypothetical protein